MTLGTNYGGEANTIRWDLSAMAQLATACEGKAEQLLMLRRQALIAADEGGRVLDMRLAVIAAHWAEGAATKLRKRRIMLAMAENSLAAALGAVGPIDQAAWKPALRSRPVEDVEQDLQAALRAGREVKAAELTMELVTAQRDFLLMSEEPDLSAVGELQRLIDFLAYEMARQRPPTVVDWNATIQAADQIKRLLDESWFRDVRRTDLLAISEIFGGLAGGNLDGVVAQLEDAHLYRWLREMDGIGGGNLTVKEEQSVFRAIAQHASAATIFRVANAERGAKFPEIALAVETSAPPAVAIDFVELCAAAASRSTLALTAALSGLVALAPAARVVAYTALVRSGSAELLAAATTEFLKAQIVERDDPVLVEFLEGVLAGLTSAVDATWDLTAALLVDSHEFREAWADLGRTISYVVQDPITLVAVILDVDTLAKNPARWSGEAVADISTLGLGKLARLGRLGAAAKVVADRLRKLTTKTAGVGRLEVEAGHLATTVDRLASATDALATRQLIEQHIQVETLNDELDALIGRLPELEIGAALHLIRTIGQTVESVIDDIAEVLAA